MSKPANVIQIIDSLSVGGAEMMAVNIANGLSERKINSHLCVTRSEGLLKEKVNTAVGYLYLNKNNIFDLQAVLKLRGYIKKHSIEIVHAHSSSFFTAILLKLFFTKVKIVWHDHYGKSEKIKSRNSLAIQGSSVLFNYVVSVNTTLLTWAKDKLLCRKVEFLPNFGVLSTSPNKTILNGEKGKRIVCVAAFRPQKDHVNLLEAFALIRNQHPSWTLHLVGDKSDDFYSGSIETVIHNKNLKDFVYFYHNCLDIKNILNQADIAVLSSNSEGLPVALLEYGLAALPVVVTDVGACSKVVGDHGFVVSKESALAMGSAILTYIEDEYLRAEKARKFHHHVIKNYSVNAYLSRLINIYHSC